jgi:Tfp pilus assembly major pilin PilA
MKIRSTKNGFTVYQLLITIIVLVIVGALWGAYSQHQQMKQQQRTDLIQSKNG